MKTQNYMDAYAGLIVILLLGPVTPTTDCYHGPLFVAVNSVMTESAKSLQTVTPN